MRYIEKDMLSQLVIEGQTLLKKSRHYNQNNRVREIIRMVYSGCCAFCESSLEQTSFFQIEHFYPKNISTFKIHVKRIENLHYSCQRCNTLKGKKVHLKIFSPNFFLDKKKWKLTKSTKIENELYYVGHILFSKNSTISSIDREKKL